MNDKLDLHGVAYGDAIDLVHQFVNSNWRPNLELHIITGNSTKMQSLVMSVLEQYDLELVVNDMKNNGRIKFHTWYE